MKKNIIKIVLVLGIVTMGFNSCSNEFIDPEFHQGKLQAPINTIEEIEAFVRGGYTSMRGAKYYGCDFLMYGEVRSDNMYSDYANGGGYYQTVAIYDFLNSTHAYPVDTYNAIYTVIMKANIVINNVPTQALTMKGETNPVTIQKKLDYLKGEAYAQRAQAAFDALRLYGQQYAGGTLGVVIPTKYDPYAKQARLSVSDSDAQIESDFIQAETLIASGISSSEGKYRLNLLSLKGLMSRFYLYKGDYAKVRSLVNDIIGLSLNSAPYKVASNSDYPGFFSTSKSAINSMFELGVGITNSLGTTSLAYKMAPGGYQNVKVLNDLKGDYHPADVRKGMINASTNLLSKYTKMEADIKILRYEEVLLNGAEAELNGGSATKALGYINEIIKNRSKDDLNTLPLYGSVALADVYKERQRELVGEGFGYWDLLRLGKPINERSSSGATTTVRNIGDNKLAFPIPQAELNVAGGLVVQNPSY